MLVHEITIDAVDGLPNLAFDHDLRVGDYLVVSASLVFGGSVGRVCVMRCYADARSAVTDADYGNETELFFGAMCRYRNLGEYEVWHIVPVDDDVVESLRLLRAASSLGVM